jgi:transmembrane sensor
MMKNQPQGQSMLQDEIPAEMRAALEWLVRLNDTDVPAGLHRQFEHWLAAAPEHRQAWAQANALWAGMEPVKTEFDSLRRRDRMASRRQVLGGLVGAGLLSAGGWHFTRPWFGADHMTVAGETRDITLADGSLVTLGSRSALALDFDGDRRGVRLLRGEAFFALAEAPLPFTVSAQGGEILSLDARFSVRLVQDRVDVAVAQSQVLLELAQQQSLSLRTGWATGYDRNRILPPHEVDIADIASWRQGRLVFQKASLAEVLAEIERWRGGRIHVWDADVAAIPVSAVFNAHEPQLALEALVQTLGLRLLDLPGPISFVRA